MHNKPMISLGFTLLELIMTVSIGVVLIGIAAPSFNRLITDSRTTATANELVVALAYARSEAIKRGKQVTVRHKGELSRVWQEGWEIFTDNNGDGTLNTMDELLNTHDVLPIGYTLNTGANYAKWVAYQSSGLSNGNTGLANDTFRLCDHSKDKKRSRAIIIKMGRVRTEVGTATCP